MPLVNPDFRMIFEHAPIGIAVVDAELRYLDANAAYCQMLGYTKEELLERRVPDVTHPEDRQRDVEFSQPLQAGLLPRYRAHKRYVHKSGRTVWGEMTALALRDEGGVSYTFSIVKDISERMDLQGLLPICSSCKKVRDDKGYWNQVDVYLREHAGIDVNVGRCPECARKQAGEGNFLP